jgi:hypothetical protein
MPHWGRPPGGSSGVGRYYEGMEDVHRFQEVRSAEENNGVLSNQAFQPALNGKNINPDELYFNDMDIRGGRGASCGVFGGISRDALSACTRQDTDSESSRKCRRTTKPRRT